MEHSEETTVVTPLRTRISASAAIAALVGALGILAAPALSLASDGTTITTNYPAVAVEPGKTASFVLTVASTSQKRVDLAVAEVPEGWKATLRGGGSVIDAVFAGPSDSPEVQLDVDVPDTVSEGTFQVVVQATASGTQHALTLDLRVAEDAGGAVSLTSDFPELRGAPDLVFRFNLELRNDTPTETTFGLSAAGPPGWQTTATPSGQTQASSATVASGSASTIAVEVDPPDDVEAGTYPITVTAAGGDQTAELVLQVEITGRVAMTLTTPEGRLSANASAGQAKEIQLVVRNEGTAPITGVTLSQTGPRDWEVAFEPETIAEIAPGADGNVVARLTPSNEAIAGDYIVTFTANAADGASERADIRVTVETALSWGLVGIALIILTLVGLGWVFQRYGRR